MYGKSNMETYITICKIANGNLLYDSGNSNRGPVTIYNAIILQLKNKVAKKKMFALA